MVLFMKRSFLYSKRMDSQPVLLLGEGVSVETLETHLDLPLQDMHTFLLSLLARAFAIIVLPVPGGPWNNNTIPAP